jgi:hypothetical protein
MERWCLNNELHDVLERVQSLSNDVLPLDVEVWEHFNIHRSFRQGATTRAKQKNVPEATIELNNRWRKVQNRGGGLPNLPMSQLYIEISQALSSKLHFSHSF